MRLKTGQLCISVSDKLNNIFCFPGKGHSVVNITFDMNQIIMCEYTRRPESIVFFIQK